MAGNNNLSTSSGPDRDLEVRYSELLKKFRNWVSIDFQLIEQESKSSTADLFAFFLKVGDTPTESHKELTASAVDVYLAPFCTSCGKTIPVFLGVCPICQATLDKSALPNFK